MRSDLFAAGASDMGDKSASYLERLCGIPQPPGKLAFHWQRGWAPPRVRRSRCLYKTLDQPGKNTDLFPGGYTLVWWRH